MSGRQFLTAVTHLGLVTANGNFGLEHAVGVLRRIKRAGDGGRADAEEFEKRAAMKANAKENPIQNSRYNKLLSHSNSDSNVSENESQSQFDSDSDNDEDDETDESEVSLVTLRFFFIC
tara:strand:- start:1146 stop:1502 length:357 start_codon:yes stop_codon:yes gene_type:complete